MTGGEILGLIALVVLVGAGAVLAAAETSLTHMRRARAAVLARGDRENGNGHEEGDADDRTGLLLQVLEERSRYLGPILLMLLVCQLGAAGLTTVIVKDRFGGGWVAPS